MECNVPTDVVFSFTGLTLRGGQSGPHADGWGLALYEGRFARVFLEPEPACSSVLAAFLRDNPIRTLMAVAHVRRRTQGGVSLENTHPFKRVMWGRDWTFAHNGTLERVRQRPLSRWHPVGETDSEYAFCWLLEQLEAAFPAGDPGPDDEVFTRTIAQLGGTLGAEGSCNFLLGDGRRLYARCGTRLCYLIRQAPFGRATLRDADVQIDFGAVTSRSDRVAVVATEPLTRDETWTIGQPGTLWVFGNGHLRATLVSADPSGRPEWSREPDAA